MKKLIIFLMLPYCLMSPSLFKNLSSASAKAETSTYAKAVANCTLYKSQTLENTPSNIYFIVPESYFVIILDKVTDECYKVQYDKYIGYVNTTTIIVATFIPIVKTLEKITVDIKETSGTQVWSTPNTNGKILTTISAGFKDISYIASCYGSIPSGGESNLWYYVSFTPSENSTNVYEGYIYSENTTNLSEIIYNSEVNPEVIEDNICGSDVIYLSSSLKTVIIIIITIPIIIFILIILYKSTKKVKEYTNNKITKQTVSSKSEFNNNQSKPDSYVFNHSFESSNTSQNNSLKDNLSRLKNLTFVKKSNSSENLNSSYPAFPDYNPEDDIL